MGCFWSKRDSKSKSHFSYNKEFKPAKEHWPISSNQRQTFGNSVARDQENERMRRREDDRMEREQQVERQRIRQREQIERSNQQMIQILRRQLDEQR